MLLPPARNLEILALLGHDRPMRSLLSHLRRLGCTVDPVRTLAAARAAFASAGGHQVLLLGPDVLPALGEQVLRSLRALDPDLAVASFGPRCAGLEQPLRSTVLGQTHPSSRAGVGALLRWLRGLPERA